MYVILWYCLSWVATAPCVSGLVRVFLEYALIILWSFAKAPGLSGGRGEMAMAVASSARLAFFVVQSAPVVCRTPDALPLVPVQR